MNIIAKFDRTTQHAIRHTVHCLIGCGIGEVLGMLLASAFGWQRLGRLALAVVLAFAGGYTLTYRGVRRQVPSASDAFKITVATDTTSIATMELVDSAVELAIPNALMVTAAQPRFWWGLVLALAIAFVVTVPVNRYTMSRMPSGHNHGSV